MLDTRGKLLAAEPRRASGERSNNPMVRRRYQSGSLFLRGKRTKVWVGQHNLRRDLTGCRTVTPPVAGPSSPFSKHKRFRELLLKLLRHPTCP
jgi:hypothetical protein